VLALIEDARFAPVFGAGGRAEVSIVGRLARPGQLPVLVSGPNRPPGGRPERGADRRFQDQPDPPGSAAEAPSAYIRQLALYRGVLQKLYPPLPIRTALLWTEAPEMMEISTPALDTELASILGGDDRA